jgi:ubiquitin conjugation factor E4 B
LRLFIIISNPRVSENLGPLELVNCLVSRSSFSDPLISTSSTSSLTLTPSEVETLLQDLARRFEPDNEIDGVLGPVARLLFFHEALLRPEGLIDAVSEWRRVASAIEAFVSVKGIGAMVTRMEEWLPPATSGAMFETTSLMGPLCRLGILGGDWVRSSCIFYSMSISNLSHSLQYCKPTFRIQKS